VRQFKQKKIANIKYFKSCGVYINNSLHLAQKYGQIFVCRHYLFREASSLITRAKLKENCELWETDNVQGQVSEHIVTPNGRYCVYYPSYIFCNMCGFETWGISLGYSQVLAGGNSVTLRV